MNTSMYEQRLASIFVTERKEKAASARKLEAAKAKGENETHAEETHATEILATEEKARGACIALRAELAEKVRRDSLVNPDDVDSKALPLLESGVMKADDFAALTERYNENPTMLRLIALYARKRGAEASIMRDSAERKAMENIVKSCDSVLPAELDRFDQLTEKLSAEGNQESMSCEC